MRLILEVLRYQYCGALIFSFLLPRTAEALALMWDHWWLPRHQERLSTILKMTIFTRPSPKYTQNLRQNHTINEQNLSVRRFSCPWTEHSCYQSPIRWYLSWGMLCFNTLRPRQNGHHFADDTFKHIFLNENIRISIKISLKFVPMGPINNIPALVHIMAWRRPGDKPLSEPLMVRLPTHICVTRPQWVNKIIC